MPRDVLVDTCLWVPFFNRPGSLEKKTIDRLLDDDRAVVIGPIVAEVLQGIRRQQAADWAVSALAGVRYHELTWDDWRSAADLGRRLAAQGNQLPLSDLALAAVALRQDWLVYSTDPHFDLIAELQRFTPSK